MKTCSKCGVPKNLGDFTKRASSKDGHESYCRACVKSSNAANYKKNRASILAQKKTYWAANKDELKPKNRARWAANRTRYAETAARWRAANREALLTYFQQRGEQHRGHTDSLKDCPCLDCGQTFPPYVMEFDHVRGTKRFALGKMSNHSRKAIEAELLKCELVCCACHRVRSQQRRKVTALPRLGEFHGWINRLKANPCLDCGQTLAPEAMDFDHVRGAKVDGISQMWSWSQDKVLAEIAKCELVCANCHRIRTQTRDVGEEQVA